MRPRLLDLFCGGGGAAEGYTRAGFDVVGIDLHPQPDYPFPFIRADALAPPVELASFDLIHASPPCQVHSPMANRGRVLGGIANDRVDLIPAVRTMLKGLPYVIENVYGSGLAGARLSGEMFGLEVHRPRLFETSFLLMAWQMPRANAKYGVYGKGLNRLLWERGDGSRLQTPPDLAAARVSVGMPFGSWETLCQCVPPPYTEYIGNAFRELQ